MLLARLAREQSPQGLDEEVPLCFPAAVSSHAGGLVLWHAWGRLLPLQIPLQLKRETGPLRGLSLCSLLLSDIWNAQRQEREINLFN